VAIEGAPDDQLVPVTRQRRRLETLLSALDAESWQAPSRCALWTVQDVVSHIVGVNAFWYASVIAGRRGAPTRLLSGFDPAATPALMVDAMRSLSAGEVFDQFVSSNDAFLGALSDLDASDWAALAESPAGHVSVRLLAFHALWDCWVHERDIALPLGLAPAVEPDEVSSCLRYAAAVSPALALGFDEVTVEVLAVEASDPAMRFVLTIDESVEVRDGRGPSDAACLRGQAVELTEALSLRSPLPPSAPPAWQRLLGGLATAFDLPS
jgi:uncharacterized protein (TIGR03083 family)